MAIKTFRPHVSTTVEIDIIDSTSKFEAIVGQAGTGALLLFVSGSTAALTTIEYESGSVAGLSALRRETYPMRMIAAGVMAMDTPMCALCCWAHRVASRLWTAGCCLACRSRVLSVILITVPALGKLSCSFMHRPSKPLQS